MLHILERINQGEVTVADVNLLNDVAGQIAGKCLCPLGEFAATPVLKSLKDWRGDFDAHAKDAKKAAPARPTRPAAAAKPKVPEAAGD